MNQLNEYLNLLKFGAIASIAMLIAFAVVAIVRLAGSTMANTKRSEAEQRQAILEAQVAHLVRQLDYLVSIVARPR